MYYEVAWWNDEEQMNDPEFLEFKTKQEALDYYDTHKNDANRYGWWVTQRDSRGYVVHDIIY